MRDSLNAHNLQKLVRKLAETFVPEVIKRMTMSDLRKFYGRLQPLTTKVKKK